MADLREVVVAVEQSEGGGEHGPNNLGALLHAAGHTEEAEQWIGRAADSGTPPP